jgi:hypothetical protein
MNLQELKHSLNNDTDMSKIYAKIKEYATSDWSYCPFAHGNITVEDEISDLQVEILRVEGYTVEWNRPCLWYEVSGWK